jgi:hypothetical protein
MSADDRLYRANVGKDMNIKELESLIASSGALIHRVDRKERETVVFFSGEDEAAERCRESLSRYGKVALDSVGADELLKLP